MVWRRFGAMAILAAASAALAACGTAASTSPSVTGAALGGSPPRTLVRPGDAFHGILSSSRDLGPIEPAVPVSFLALLRNPTAVQEATALAALYTPHSPTFGRSMTLQQVQSRYGPRPAAVAAAGAWLRRQGLTIRWQRGDAWMLVSGPARAVEAAFSVRIRRYLSVSGKRFYASAGDARIPGALRRAVQSIGRISSYSGVRPYAVPANGLKPQDLLAAYQMGPLQALHMDGSGQTVSFIEVDGFAQNDLTEFAQRFHLPPLVPELRFGPPLPPGGETEMDVEVVHAIAPKAKLRIYNCPGDCTDAQETQAIARAVQENPGGIISMSLGQCETITGSADMLAYENAFNQAVALRESAFASTGDSGAYTCLTEDWTAPPSTQYAHLSDLSTMPNVTGVGGTRLSVRQDGNRYREEVWENAVETAGPGGGVSVIVPLPDYQNGVLDAQNNPNHMRQSPDVSADADPLTGAAIRDPSGWSQGGGTSQAAPIWAGMTALINQYLESKGLRPLGFMNAALYALAAGSPQYPPFYDVTSGSNLLYPAHPGYDLASGLGTPNAWNLARDLEAYIKSGSH